MGFKADKVDRGVRNNEGKGKNTTKLMNIKRQLGNEDTVYHILRNYKSY